MITLTFSGSSKERLSIIMFPKMLNKRSEAQVVVQMQRYFLASTDNVGNEAENPLYHINGLESASGFGDCN